MRLTPPRATLLGFGLVALAIVAAGVMRYSAVDPGGNWQLVPRGDDQYLIFNTQDGLVAYTCHMDDKTHKLDC